jgi:hypothetical protein
MYHIVITDERHGRVTEEQKVLQEIGCTPKVCNFTSDEEALPVLKEADGIIVNLFPMTGTSLATVWDMTMLMWKRQPGPVSR